jgi:hypothetical protein
MMCWPKFPTHCGGMDDMVMWYYVANAWMHCVAVATGIGTSIVILFSN